MAYVGLRVKELLHAAVVSHGTQSKRVFLLHAAHETPQNRYDTWSTDSLLAYDLQASCRTVVPLQTL